MSQQAHKDVVHKDAAGHSYSIETHGSQQRLVRDDTPRPRTILGALAKALLGRF